MLSTSSIDPLKQVIFSVPKFQPLSQELYLIIPVLLSRPHRAQSHLWVKPELESSFRDPEEKSPAQGRDLETGRINLSLGSLQTLDQVIDGPVEGEDGILRKGRHPPGGSHVRQGQTMHRQDPAAQVDPISSTCQVSPLPTGATHIMGAEGPACH